MTADVLTRNTTADEHLQLLQSLTGELERAMCAIVRNELAELEDSVAAQQDLSQRLSVLASHMRASSPEIPAQSIDPSLKTQIRSAAFELQKLNLRYSALLEHSSRSVALMASLFNSFRGQIQEASGAGSKQQTWSCRI